MFGPAGDAADDAGNKAEDARLAKLNIASWELAAVNAVREFIVSSGRYSHQCQFSAISDGSIIASHNGTPVRITIEALTGSERDAFVRGWADTTARLAGEVA